MARIKKNQDEMSFMDHLEDLRWVLVKSTIAVLICAIGAFFISDFIFDVVIFGPTDPNFITYQYFCEISKAVGIGSACVQDMDFIIQNTNMEGQFNMLIWICITCGFILAFPYILWLFWSFISPALYEKERKGAGQFIIFASLLFFVGVLFGYFVLTPMSVNFFATFSISHVIKNEFNLDSYVGLIKTSVIASGLLFELPIVMYFLTKAGLVTPEFLIKYRKYALIIILILAAIVTPPDVVSQIIVGIPMYMIFELSIQVAKRASKKKLKAAAAADITEV